MILITADNKNSKNKRRVIIIENNTIILLNGEADLTIREMAAFTKGDTIFGNDSEPQEIARWCLADKKGAETALSKKRCTYTNGIDTTICIEEYALQFCTLDENGEFIAGADYDLAQEE